MVKNKLSKLLEWKLSFNFSFLQIYLNKQQSSISEQQKSAISEHRKYVYGKIIKNQTKSLTTRIKAKKLKHNSCHCQI